jgi:light-regulated signal transduction histidine kinase (bacteriophytochrome)
MAGFNSYWVTEDADPPSVGPDRRLRSHQTSPPTSTAAARIPNAIQPHCVLLVSASSFLFAAAAAAAAAAAGLSPEVVVAATVVAGAGAATVAVWVRT